MDELEGFRFELEPIPRKPKTSNAHKQVTEGAAEQLGQNELDILHYARFLGTDEWRRK